MHAPAHSFDGNRHKEGRSLTYNLFLHLNIDDLVKSQIHLLNT